MKHPQAPRPGAHDAPQTPPAAMPAKTRTQPGRNGARASEDSPPDSLPPARGNGSEGPDSRGAAEDDSLLEQTRRSAYALYEARGCVHGHDLDDWLQAQLQVGERSSDQARSATLR